MIEQLMELAGCGDADIERRASVALELHETYANGGLTDDEYRELLEDLINTDQIDELSSDVQLKGMLITGVSGLISIL